MGHPPSLGAGVRAECIAWIAFCPNEACRRNYLARTLCRQRLDSKSIDARTAVKIARLPELFAA